MVVFFMEMITVVYFLLASILLTLAPGPDNMYLLAKSLSDGARSGVCLTAGLCSGIFFHTMLVIVGVAALIQQSPMALIALKYIGAIYLLYLAWGAWKSSGDLKLNATEKTRSYIKLYRRGLIMNVLNPKVLLFFLAFFPQFVDLNAQNVSMQIACLGILFAMQGFIIFSLIAICASKVRHYILHIKNFSSIMNKVEAVVLLIISFTLIVS